MFKKELNFVFFAVISLLTIFALKKYPGQLSVYIFFTLISNALLYIGFCKKAIFFDTFIGLFFWLGFWLKLTIRVAFFDGFFHESVGEFDFTGIGFDRSLLVATCGLSGLLLANLIRNRMNFNYCDHEENCQNKNLYDFYLRNKKIILSFFVLFFLFVAISNGLLGIYQRGAHTQTYLPSGLNGMYKWLLLFGFSSLSALILSFEFRARKKIPIFVLFLSFFECFVSNVSMLSRGMILNAGALLYGVLITFKLNVIRTRLNFLVIAFLMFSILFISSVLLVNYFRAGLYLNGNYEIKESAAPLFIYRWVGIEGVMAVSSHENLGWDLLKKASKESYNENETSFYDNNFITSPYINSDKTQHHFISLPGVIAFVFYAGSFYFLFFIMFVLGWVGAIVEFSVYKLGGKNLILSALFSQVVAFRFSNFGYVPAQSYLLLGALILNLLIIHWAEKYIGSLRKYFRKFFHI